jgi:glycosyltransferase involved in cell wall biosynthesis
MSTQLALFPSSLDVLRAQDRLGALRESYLFSGFDRTLCVFLRNEHGDARRQRMDDRFEYLEIGLRRFAAAGPPGRALGVAGAVAALVRAAREHSVDAVLAYDPHLLGLLGLATARALRRPFGIRLICHYGLKWDHTRQLAFAPFRSRRVEEMVERFVYRRAATVLVACPNHEAYVRELAPEARTTPYLTAQSALFYQSPPGGREVRERLAPGVRRVIVSVGRLLPEKYAEDLVAIATNLDDPDAALVIVGDGPLRGRMEAAARISRTRVVFAGMQPQQTVRALFASADAAIVLQGGGAITEAALSTAPIVTYDFEMNPFVVRPGFEEGVLVPFRDTAAAAAAVRRLLDDPAHARRLGENARRAALARFSDQAARAAERAAAARLLGDPGPDAGDPWQLTRRFGAAA